MYFGNVKQVEEFHPLILQSLRDIGTKPRLKKSYFSKSNQDSRCVTKDNRIFKKPLCNLRTENVKLKSGATVEIPVFVVATCNYIKHRCDVEGIFRKAGSAARLREIKAIVDSGKQLDPQHHVVDVSNILKLFFRELPEPLLPYTFHDLLLRCLLNKDKADEGVLLSCLLFPSVHLNTLAYVMEFFRDIADNEETNKMSITNLAIVITPSLMPVEEKIVVNNCSRLDHHVRVIKILMQNTEKIGFVPEPLVKKAMSNGCALPNNDETDVSDNDGLKIKKKKKKRRSASLTRMINGLKKMVGKGSPESPEHLITSAPDFSSPCMKSAKKRKLRESGAFSSKKKREILQSLPQNITLADAPCTPMVGELCPTPRVHLHPNPCGKSASPKLKQNNGHKNEKSILTVSKSESHLKSRLIVKKSGKKMKKNENAASVNQRSPNTSCLSEKAPRRSLDWQWKSGPWRRKKCLNSSDTPVCSARQAKPRLSDSIFCSGNTSYASIFDEGVDLSTSISSSDTEFVKIPKSEYEEIKNRVSAIENRITHEFGCIASDPNSLNDIPLIDETEDEMCSAKKVQNAYEKTLEESEKLGDPVTTDQLAKRLSKELKIRHSLENKVIRSPSARKIGTIRRKSRENAKTSLSKISKNSPNRVVSQTSGKHDPSSYACQDQVFYPKSNLRRGRPNTVYSGLPHPSPLRITTSAENTENMKMSFAYSVLPVSDKQNTSETVCQMMSSSDSLSCKDDVKSPQEYVLSGVPPKKIFSRHGVKCASFHGTDLQHNTSDKVHCNIRKSISEMDVAFSTPCTIKTPRCGNINNPEDAECWKNAPQFFGNQEVPNVPVSGRESIAKIRSQNAGMVLARTQLFDKKQGSQKILSQSSCIQTENEMKPTLLTHHNGQSLRVQCMQDNFLGKLYPQSTLAERRQSVRMNAAGNNSVGQSVVLKDSPKKIGSPRKKYQSQKSPRSVSRRQKPKTSKSPQKVKVTLTSGNECNLRKVNSLREASSQSPFTSKVNLTAPASVLNCGKENMSSKNNLKISTEVKINNENSDKKTKLLQQIHLPENLKETIYDVCTPKLEKLSKTSMSPLKDCNRIDVNTCQFENNRQNVYKTPRSTPYIKTPLIAKSPTEYSRTPYCRTPVATSHLHRLVTPLRALPNLNAITPVALHQQTQAFLPGKCRNIVKS